MRTTRTHEDTPATIVLALGLWAAGTAIAAALGAFAKFTPAFIGALAAFAFALAVATPILDARVRATIARMSFTLLAILALSADALLGAAAYASTFMGQPLASVPLMVAVLFVAPVGGAAHWVALHRWLGERGGRARVRSERRLTSALG